MAGEFLHDGDKQMRQLMGGHDGSPLVYVILIVVFRKFGGGSPLWSLCFCVVGFNHCFGNPHANREPPCRNILSTYHNWRWTLLHGDLLAARAFHVDVQVGDHFQVVHQDGCHPPSAPTLSTKKRCRRGITSTSHVLASPVVVLYNQ